MVFNIVFMLIIFLLVGYVLICVFIMVLNLNDFKMLIYMLDFGVIVGCDYCGIVIVMLLVDDFYNY